MTQVFDQRSYRLQQGADVICQTAESHCGISVDDLTRHRTRQVIGLMRDIDTYFDQPGSTTAGSMELLTDPSSPYFERYPSLFPDQIEPEAYRDFLRFTRDIFLMGKLASEATSLEDFVFYRQYEGQLIGDWIASVASPHVKQQPAYARDMVPMMEMVAVSGNFYDSFVDARRDYAEGQLHVKPNLEFYKRVGTLAIHNTIPALGITLHPPVLKQLFIMAGNRMTNIALYDKNGDSRRWLPRESHKIRRITKIKPPLS